MIARSVLACFVVLGVVGLCAAGELAVEDFQFDGPVGCQGAKIEKVADNHFKITLGHAPNEPGWANHLQFRILRNAKGKDLKITAVFVGETGYSFVSNHSSWSYDGNEWRPVTGCNSRTSRDGNVLTRTAELSFPAMEQDTFWFGWEVPFTYEKQVEMIERWSKSPFVKVRVLGESLRLPEGIAVLASRR